MAIGQESKFMQVQQREVIKTSLFLCVIFFLYTKKNTGGQICKENFLNECRKNNFGKKLEETEKNWLT